MTKNLNCYTKIREKAPQKAGTYTYTMTIWEPPLEFYKHNLKLNFEKSDHVPLNSKFTFKFKI